MKIKSFIFLLNLGVIFILAILLYTVYNDQQKKLTTIIISNIKKDLNDIRYISNKFLNQQNQIYTLRPILDRKIAKNDLIKGFILVKNNKKIFVSGDVNIKIPTKNIHTNIKNINLNDLLNKTAFLIPIEFYIQNKKQTYKLYTYLEKNKLKEIFKDLRYKYLLIFLFLVILIFIVLQLIIQKYLITPLLELKKFAQRQKNIPKNSLINELNDIKNALSISFDKLDKTINHLYTNSITDPLTNLGNKKLLLKEIEDLINNNQTFCIVFLDLDNFKEINDFYGHNIGDKLIVQVSKILKTFIYKNEILTRIGGDEFILILQECSSLENRINNLLNILDKTWYINNQELVTSASIGISIYPNDATSSEELLKNADIAMYEAKQKGKNKFVIFNNDLKNKIDNIFNLKNRLKKAIQNNEFELYYQPKIAKNGNIIGCEALIRWNSDEGIIYPTTFIPIAEKTNLIYDIGLWVIKEAFSQIKEWENNKYLKDISIAFNISVAQLKYENFLNDLQLLIAQINPNISKLEIEITESVFIDNTKTIYLIELLRALGFKINLDDFGTGYSSLSVLKEFKIDRLKIDKSFVDEVETQKGQIYIKTIIDMAKNLNITTIAEGIETKKQFEIIKELGADIYQGYYFAKPLKKEDFEKFVINYKII